MDWLITLLITWIVITISFVIITVLPLGVESDSLGKTATAAAVFGLLNGLAGWFINSLLLNVLTLGLGFLIGNAILFGLTALLVRGFRLRWGIISALIGGLALAIINSILFKVLAIS
ncbi:phage holin family protein [Romeria aff. gracilis LEGE 07310]|uniref:Phage holin family protein n=1 Tax=Vasconcelosia minhoensis LEGE 07310 TaxID=915328 RepID=A0A8J7DF41_9CYAN|nr:phage holin family protein [Romeria gracilis]MBE9080393.1 phage holin family protein [Romeria aff. gracilis LEGE 07310]